MKKNYQLSIANYQLYKDSGVEWLGEVPAHWRMRRLKDLGIGGLTNGIFKKKDQFGKGAKLVNVRDIYQEDNLIKNQELERVDTTKDENKRYAVQGGDVFFVRSSLKLEGIGVSSLFEEVAEPTVFECHIIRFRPNCAFVYPKFLIYLLNSQKVQFRFVAISQTVTMTTISQEKISTLELMIPPPDEQRAIAAYLDEKTAQIDRQIDLLTRKIETYGRLKQSLINETVTRGLDNSAPLKDSGVEWVGEIPAHWEVKHFKQFSTMKGRIGWQGLKHAEFTDEGPFLITGMNFKSGKINWDEVYHITEERYEQAPEIQLKDHDVLMTKDGTIGKLLYVEDIPYPHKASLNSHLLVFRPIRNRYYPKYLYYQLGSSTFKHYTDVVKTGTTFFGISQAVVSQYIGMLPPLDEQRAIAAYLDEKTAHIDRIVQKIQAKIKTLQDLRKTLINDVVTGKIKIIDN